MVGLSATRNSDDTGLDFGPGNQAGLLIVLDADGTLLAQRAMGRVDFLHVGAPDDADGGRGVILVASGGRLRRVTFGAP